MFATMALHIMREWFEYYHETSSVDDNEKTYSDQKTYTSSHWGGQIYVKECAFEAHETSGAVRIDKKSSIALFEDCLFKNCNSVSDAGGLYFNANEIVLSRDCFYKCQNVLEGQAFVLLIADAGQVKRNAALTTTVVDCGKDSKHGTVTFSMSSGYINISDFNGTGNKCRDNSCCQILADSIDSYITFSTFYKNDQLYDISLTLNPGDTTAYIKNTNFIKNTIEDEPDSAQFYTTKYARIIKCSFIENGPFLFQSLNGRMIVEYCFIDTKDIRTKGIVNYQPRRLYTIFFDYMHLNTKDCIANELNIDLLLNPKEECTKDENCGLERQQASNLILISAFRLSF